MMISAPESSASRSWSRLVTSISILTVWGISVRARGNRLDNSSVATERGNVVVLDHHAVEQADPVIEPTAVPNCRLFEHPHARARLASVDNFDACSCHCADVPVGQGRHA